MRQLKHFAFTSAVVMAQRTSQFLMYSVKLRLPWQIKVAISCKYMYKCQQHNTLLFDTSLWCTTIITTTSSVACSIRQPPLPLLQNSYRDGDRAPALVLEHRSQQLANVNLPDTHSGVGAPRQQQFSTACE